VTTEATTPSTTPPSSPKGLEGVVAGNTALSKVFGEEGRLIYRGIAIEPLAEQATFEETIYLLWYDRLPNRAEYDAFRAELAAWSRIPEEFWAVVKPLAERKQSLMDLLRTSVSALSAWDPDVASTRDATDVATRGETNLRIAKRVMGAMGSLVAGCWRLREGETPIEPRDDLSIAANFLYMLTGQEPGEYEERIFDAALTLHADHGFNASTFSARVTAGTESDIYAAMTSAIGTLAGRLHGGANMRVMAMLQDIGEIDRVEPYITSILSQPKGRVMGFGHRVYKVEDPRATVLRRMARELTSRTGNSKWFEMSVKVEQIVLDQKGIYPNVDFYSASVYGSLNLDLELFTPIFALSRASGWLAHIMEQHADNRLIRPRANWIGHLSRDFVSIDER
jgi:citrate synthase